MGLRVAGFIWIGGSLGFRFWRVFAREFFRDFSRKCRKAIGVGVRGKCERFLGNVKAKTSKRTFVLSCTGGGVCVVEKWIRLLVSLG